MSCPIRYESMKIQFVDLTRQYGDIKDDLDTAIRSVLEEGAFIGGRHVASFETAFAEFCGVKHCIGVGNGTDAIFVTLKALGIGPGHEVITAANSFIATSEAITLSGAKVVFVDIDPKTYNIDPSKIEPKVTSRTRAIIPVHLYGHPADMDPILDLARSRKLFVIEDAAQAHGASYKGKPIGSLGDAACFSFYPSKNLGAYGDAGAIVTNSDDLALKARMIANHGRIGKYDHEIEGLNSRLDGLQGAILLAKLKYLPEWTKRRREHAQLYNRLLASTGVVTPLEMPYARAVYHLYVIRVKSRTRTSLRAYLGRQNIATGIHYPASLPNLPAYSYLEHGPLKFPEATNASNEIVSLPMYPELREPEISFVCNKVSEFLSGQPRYPLAVSSPGEAERD
jgi:dTDP-4-amino-4,6-dideoxygalactose transaminase